MQLPLSCNARYLENFIGAKDAADIFRLLVEDYDIQQMRLKIDSPDSMLSDFGKLMLMDQDLFDGGVFPEAVWGKTAVWPEKLGALRHKVEMTTGREFKICVCIYYPDGNSWVDYHSDPPAFGDTTIIASLSLGAERTFHLRENSSGSDYSLTLKPGSLLIMGEQCQADYQHCLPPQPACSKPRINLTFRQYGYE